MRSPLYRGVFIDVIFEDLLSLSFSLAESGTPRNTHFPSSLDMGHAGP